MWIPDISFYSILWYKMNRLYTFRQWHCHTLLLSKPQRCTQSGATRGLSVLVSLLWFEASVEIYCWWVYYVSTIITTLNNCVKSILWMGFKKIRDIAYITVFSSLQQAKRTYPQFNRQPVPQANTNFSLPYKSAITPSTKPLHTTASLAAYARVDSGYPLSSVTGPVSSNYTKSNSRQGMATFPSRDEQQCILKPPSGNQK